jgi:hypothetical protein
VRDEAVYRDAGPGEDRGAAENAGVGVVDVSAFYDRLARSVRKRLSPSPDPNGVRIGRVAEAVRSAPAATYCLVHYAALSED